MIFAEKKMDFLWRWETIVTVRLTANWNSKPKAWRKKRWGVFLRWPKWYFYVYFETSLNPSVQRISMAIMDVWMESIMMSGNWKKYACFDILISEDTALTSQFDRSIEQVMRQVLYIWNLPKLSYFFSNSGHHYLLPSPDSLYCHEKSAILCTEWFKKSQNNVENIIFGHRKYYIASLSPCLR